MKDFKQMLKEAREAIANKNFEISMKLCKQILKEDKTNYKALVFLGLSLQETGQYSKAVTTFQKAIETNPSNTLAWSGLINYYEKVENTETRMELVKAYISFLNIETVEKKLIECSEKLCNLHEYGDLTEITLTIFSLIKSGKCTEETKLASCLAELLSKHKNLPLDLLQIYEEILGILVNNTKTVCTKYYADYLNLLYKFEKKEKLFDGAKRMHAIFESDWISLRWICKIFNEVYIENETMLENEETILKYCEALSRLETPSATALLTKSILSTRANQIVEAKEMLEQVVKLLPGLLHAWILLLNCYIGLLLFTDAIQAANKVDKLLQNSAVPKEKLKKTVNTLMIEALSRSDEEQDLQRALDLYRTMDFDETNCIYHAIRANINLKNFSQSESLLADLEKRPDSEIMHRLLKAHLLHKQERYEEALKVLDNDEVTVSEWWLQIGTLYWDSGQPEKSLMPYLKATKLDPTNFRCFLLLGHYYKKMNDFQKARRCYEKAFKINTRCSEAGIELSKIYRKLKSWDANFTLLQALTAGIINRQNSWAWLQLGLHYLEQQEYDKAITSLRFVIRIDDNNMNCWESLADAYLAKGAYTSALKCYERTLSLSEGTSLYPLLQMAHIKQILGEFVEAKSDFEEILKSNQHYIPALKGIAESCLLLAKTYFKDQRLGAARAYAQKAAENVIVAIKQRCDLSCLWKLLGDSCLFVTGLPEKHCFLLLPSLTADSPDTEELKSLEKKDLFAFSVKCYCRSLSLTEDNIFIWHDLGVCYLSYSLNTNDRRDFEELIDKAEAVAKHCTSKNPTNWQHWNLLGNVAMCLDPPNYKLAQHSFIKAVIAENNSAISWSNLGTLYFLLEDYKIANEAFSQAQRSDPNYVNSWIGQALLAESLAHEDAMDLFRHSTQLSFQKQGALGYAYWVCKTLKESPLDTVIYSIHNMHAVTVACDAMTWYTEHHPSDFTAWNMLGILRERMGLESGASHAFKNALELSTGSRGDPCRVNYGRSLAALGKYSQAIGVLSTVESATFNSECGLALALFKDGRYKESYEAYKTTLHWLSDEPDYQSDLLVALASMTYMFEGPEAAKTLLFQSIQLEQASPWGFYAILALGLLHNEFNLSELVLAELRPLNNRKDSVRHIAVLSGYFHLLQNEEKMSVRAVSKLVHTHPDEASLWLTLSTLLIRLQDNRASSGAAGRCAQIAMKLGRTNTDVTKVLCLVALSFILNGDYRDALLMAQRAIHCYPYVVESWAIFLAAIVNSRRFDASYMKQVLCFVEFLDHQGRLSKWINNVTCIF